MYKYTMRIISWDIGILHLAYCILEFENNKFDIIEWDNINLVSQKENVCGICNKKALYEFDSIMYCTTHKKQLVKENDIMQFKSYKKSDNNQCNCKMKSRPSCNKKAVKNCNENNYCSFHYNKLIKNVNIICNIKKKGVKDFPIKIIKNNLIDLFDKKKQFLEIDYVLIENQPSLINPTMKSIAETLYAWFLIRGIKDKKSINDVHLINPANKLKLIDTKITDQLKTMKGSKKYNLTKKISIEYTKLILDDENFWLKSHNWIDFFNKNKKKDDLCDALLQGIYFLKNLKLYLS